MNKDSKTTIQELKERFLAFSKQRGWETGYSPDTLAKSVVIEAGELLGLFQWKDQQSSLKALDNELIRRQVIHEMVDILYYLLMFAYVTDTDVCEAVEEKLEELEKKYPPKSR